MQYDSIFLSMKLLPTSSLGSSALSQAELPTSSRKRSGLRTFFSLKGKAQNYIDIRKRGKVGGFSPFTRQSGLWNPFQLQLPYIRKSEAM